VAGEPRLEWGRLAAFDLARADRMPTDLVRVWQVAQQSLGLVARPIERFELAGTLKRASWPPSTASRNGGRSGPEPRDPPARQARRALAL
jgi:hypothetical protein